MSKKISIVTSLYKSEGFICEFYDRCILSVNEIGSDYEILLVNDGSPDRSLARAVTLSKNDPNVCVIDLARNFGHHQAILTGIEHATGDYVFTLDSDLEEDPHELVRFYRNIIDTADEEIDSVYGYRTTRDDPLVRRLISQAFHKTFTFLSGVEAVNGTIMMRLMSRRYVDSLREFREMRPFLLGLWQLVGYRQIGLKVDKAYKGSTGYLASRRIRLALDALTSFSARPLILLAAVGLSIAALAAMAAIYVFVRALVAPFDQMGWASLFVSIWFFGGAMLFSIGVIGFYISRIFEEVKGRPRVIVRQIYGRYQEIKKCSSEGFKF